MVLYALNVRAEQMDNAKSIVRLPRFSLPAAFKAAGHEILLFAAGREDNPGYFGTAILGDPIPDPTDASKFRLPIYNMRQLDREISLAELRALGVEEQPFNTYSRPIRPVFEGEQRWLIALGAIIPGFGEKDVQPFVHAQHYRRGSVEADFRQLRFEMLEAYPPFCAFTRKAYLSLDGTRYGFDAGHVWPRSAGGPSIIQNVLPMSKDVNNQWDEGMVSLTNAGNVLIAKNAGPDTRALFAGVKKIVFPEDPRLWPDTQFLERHRDEIFEKGPKWLRGES
ncbi:MAG: hypothetical protein WBQ60_00420 [Asticcacaulis sp.]